MSATIATPTQIPYRLTTLIASPADRLIQPPPLCRGVGDHLEAEVTTLKYFLRPLVEDAEALITSGRRGGPARSSSNKPATPVTPQARSRPGCQGSRTFLEDRPTEHDVPLSDALRNVRSGSGLSDRRSSRPATHRRRPTTPGRAGSCASGRHVAAARRWS